MKHETTARQSPYTGLTGILGRAYANITHLAPPSLAQFALRFALAVPFWRSGVNKWDGFLQLNEVAVLLFSSEFRLHLPGGPYPYPFPATVAFASGMAEIVLPVLLVLGLASRAAALALLVMTIVIQLTVPDGWPLHVTWAAMALAIMAWGPGRWSIDQLAGMDRLTCRQAR
ncbi:DoxX family membrane protein [Rhizobium sp. TRM96647]|uniref:DoxX family membrane protein n=1 Tax=unclassified Rhizobium TaxID=2613769 RepID=UPI0021E71C90|nr:MULTISPECIES: DoxX family membrane protein [unclassified Rhizobium]MCV3738002.1 DoxX family membrane protein [Rhizobium sp. TRM96647]MCV3759689.1 DoxX family membrane protein [Rhizobium sp. TRM96650]